MFVGKRALAFLMGFILLGAAFLSASCAATKTVTLPKVSDYYTEPEIVERKHLKVGLTSGPYGEMFSEIIAPLLEPKGYTFELIYYDNVILPNFALAEGKTDLNMFQTLKYLSNFKFTHNLELQAITEIPTAPMGIYSYKHESVERLRRGSTISIPNDPTNKARALNLLEDVKLIKLDSFIDKSKASEEDIVENPRNISFVFADLSKLAVTLNYCDLSVINGNYALSGNLKLSDALYTEERQDAGYINVIVVRNEDISSQFSLDIIEAIHSIDFFDQITGEDSKYNEFSYPHHFYYIIN